MNSQNIILRNIKCLLLLISLIFSISELYSSNRVTSVNAHQKGNDIVITYQLSEKSDVSVSVSIDGYSFKKLKNVTGDVGEAIEPGKKEIIWKVLSEYEEFIYPNVRFKVSSSGDYSKRNILLINGGFSSLPDYTYGLTYAWVKKAGFYFNAMTNFGFKFNYDGIFSGRYYSGYPFFNGEKEYTRMSITAGVLFRMRVPLYTYVGMGYGYRGLYYETVDNKWIQIHDKHTVYNGITSEIGLIGNIKGFALSLGFSILTGVDGTYYPEAKVGLGYCFN